MSEVVSDIIKRSSFNHGIDNLLLYLLVRYLVKFPKLEFKASLVDVQQQKDHVKPLPLVVNS